MHRKIQAYLPISLLILLALLAYLLGFTDYLSLEKVREHYLQLKGRVLLHPATSALFFIGLFIFIAATSIPAATLLSLVSGMLFPEPLSTIYVVIGATLGATIIFLAAKSALGDFLFTNTAPVINKMQEGFQANAWSYLIILRMVPVFPFWAVNLAAAFFNVSTKTFILTTLIGIIPFAFVVTRIGHELGDIIYDPSSFTMSNLLPVDAMLVLIGMGVAALILGYYNHHQNRWSNSE